MWWAILKKILDKNNSPAWQRINNIMSIWNTAQGMTARQFHNYKNTYDGAVDNSGTYGIYGGNE